MPTGGKVFEHYLDLMAKWSTHKLWRKHLDDHKHNDDHKMDAPTWERILKKERGPFMGFVLMATANIGNNGKTQLFYHTFNAKFHGLSRPGVDMLARYGYAMKNSLFDETEVKVYTAAVAKNR